MCPETVSVVAVVGTGAVQWGPGSVLELQAQMWIFKKSSAKLKSYWVTHLQEIQIHAQAWQEKF